MKLNQKIVTGIIAAVSLLLLSVASSYAAPKHCASGTVDKTGIYSWSNNSRTVFLTCDAAIDTWDGTSRQFFIPSGTDEDAMYAAALTAKSTNKKVEYYIARETVNSLVRVIYVLPTDAP